MMGLIPMGGIFADVGYGVAADSATDVIVVGAVRDDGRSNVWVRKYSAIGQELWTYAYAPDGSDFNFAAAVAVDSADAIVVTGVVFPAASNGDVWVQKLAP